jgi:hypothetical protein
MATFTVLKKVLLAFSSLGDEIGEIRNQTVKDDEFENFTSTKLKVGTKIYEPLEKGNIYIVLIDGKEIRYLGLIEG